MSALRCAKIFWRWKKLYEIRSQGVDAIVRAYLQELVKLGVRVERAYLFGSQSRGEAGPDSDVDLLLVSTDFATITAAEQWKILGKAALALMAPIEPLAYTPEEIEECMQREGNFIRHILNQPDTIEYTLAI